MGEMDKKAVFEVLDYFVRQGGNFVDTHVTSSLLQLAPRCLTNDIVSANLYQSGESEQWIGEWMEARNIRDQMVVATKFTSYYPLKETNIGIRSNYAGSNAKSMRLSLEASLKNLRTKYIDIV